MTTRPSLPKPALMLVTDRHASPLGELVRVVEQAVAGGVNMVQLRERDLPAGELLELGLALKHAIAGRALLIVNDRVDVAAVLDADGVQLPENGLSVSAARKIFGSHKLVGRSVHSEEGAKVAAEQGADYLVLGSVFPSDSHAGEDPLGLEVLRYLLLGIPLVSAEVAELSGLREDVQEVAPVPVLAIGGITAENAAEVLSTGAAGVAVISSILRAHNPQQAAQELAAALSL